MILVKKEAVNFGSGWEAGSATIRVVNIEPKLEAYYLYPDYNGGFLLGRWHNKIGFVSPLPTFRYVHELQQGLRMVGYTDFADGFKVE